MRKQNLIFVKDESGPFASDVIQVLEYLNSRSDQKELRQHTGNQVSLNVNSIQLTYRVTISTCKS